jgi:Domain of unknown function (DUF4260)
MKTNTVSLQKGTYTKNLLWLEQTALFAFAIIAYIHLGGPWWFFLSLFLVPDLGMLGYTINARVGALTYNAVHHFGVPLALGGIGLLTQTRETLLIAPIWLAHIAFDRMLGYGLKEPTGFTDTHLGRIGRLKHITE